MTANERRQVLRVLMDEAGKKKLNGLSGLDPFDISEIDVRDVLSVVHVAMYPRREDHISLESWIKRLDVASQLVLCIVYGDFPDMSSQPTAIPQVEELPYLLSGNIKITGGGRELRVQIEYPKEAEMKGFTE